MRKILKKNIHQKLLKMHARLGKELRSRYRFSYHRLCRLLEDMSEILIKWDSWERRRKRK